MARAALDKAELHRCLRSRRAAERRRRRELRASATLRPDRPWACMIMRCGPIPGGDVSWKLNLETSTRDVGCELQGRWAARGGAVETGASGRTTRSFTVEAMTWKVAGKSVRSSSLPIAGPLVMASPLNPVRLSSPSVSLKVLRKAQRFSSILKGCKRVVRDRRCRKNGEAVEPRRRTWSNAATMALTLRYQGALCACVQR